MVVSMQPLKKRRKINKMGFPKEVFSGWNLWVGYRLCSKIVEIILLHKITVKNEMNRKWTGLMDQSKRSNISHWLWIFFFFSNLINYEVGKIRGSNSQMISNDTTEDTEFCVDSLCRTFVTSDPLELSISSSILFTFF